MTLPNSSMPTNYNNLTKKESQHFQKTFHKVEETLLDQSKNCLGSMEVATNWLHKVISNNVSKNISDRILVSVAYKYLLGKSFCESLEPAFVLDCCLEYFNAANAISDNILNGRSKLPVSGNPTWHAKPAVGMLAVNDSLQLTILSHLILKNFFYDRVQLRYQLEDICTDALDQRTLGRGIIEKLKRDEDMKNFNLKIYRQVVNLTYGYNKFYIPVRFALKLKGEILDSEVEKIMKSILLDIGYYWKIRSDYMKIAEGKNDRSLTKTDLKINWLFVKAVEILREEKAAMNLLLDYVNQQNVNCLKIFYKQKGILQLFKDEQTFLVNGTKDKIYNFIDASDNMKNILWSVVGRNDYFVT